MAKYPEFSDIQFDFPTEVEIETRTLRSSFDGLGKEKRRRKFNYARRNFAISYSDRFLTKANVRTLWQFYLDRGGAYEAFSFFVTGPSANVSASGVNVYEGEYVGMGDGVETVFDSPSRNAGTVSVYGTIGGSTTLKSDPGDYSISLGAAADGGDQITFVSPPSAGEIITMDFIGVLRVRCRFMEDKLGYQDFYNVLARTGIELKGLLNDE